MTAWKQPKQLQTNDPGCLDTIELYHSDMKWPRKNPNCKDHKIIWKLLDTTKKDQNDPKQVHNAFQILAWNWKCCPFLFVF